ncbi:phosphoglucomutase/phosphomannomutase family protein [bacterium]|nr:phosphoglucomutase/phosphomannomutase family protein [bacterium]
MDKIKFGTDGWRAIVGKDFNEKNVIRVTIAIAKYILDNFGHRKPILIGFDPRLKAEYFAKLSAEKLAQIGFNVYLSKQVVATPVLAYSAKYRNACAIMFTASHNPPEYLGMKFIPDYAGPATEEITTEIVDNIDKEINITSQGFLNTESFDEVYIEHIEQLIDMEKIKSSNMSIFYDALFGAAGHIFTRILLKNHVKFDVRNILFDGKFGGKLPEPAERFLSELKEKCQKENKVGFSNDGDGDRFAVIDENGEFVSANEVIAIILKHLIVNKNVKGKLAKTVAGSLMLDIFAKKQGIEVVETPVGFKWVGKAMRENDIIIGGEESGGLSIKGHIPEKDGILANLLILETIAYTNKTLVQLRKEIQEEIGHSFINKRIDIKLENEELVKTALEKLNEIEKINTLKIANKNHLDGIKIYLNDNITSILVRKSGTEPLLRIYCESDNDKKIEKIFKYIRKLIEK